MNPSVDKFVAVLERSGLVERPALPRLLEQFQHAAPEQQDANGFAKFLVTQGKLTTWQAAKLLKGKHKGFFLGKYKLLSMLGKGGMSAVYLAQHTLLKRQCAIKVLPWHKLGESSHLKRFYREAQAVASLDHPHIVSAYDVDHTTDGSMEIYFLVMEYVEGRNLYEFVHTDGPLSVIQAAEFIRQGALGLNHAHQAGLVHRDIKPGNFLVDRHGVVKLMDLGLARFLQEASDSSLTIEHEQKVLGTVDYLAPEQAVDSHDVDHRADIYGLGCTLFYLLTGRSLFPEGTLTQRLMAHQTKQPPSVHEFRDDVPEAIAIILKGMLEKDPDQRTSSAEVVATQLEDWLEKQGGTQWQQLRRPSSTRSASGSHESSSQASDVKTRSSRSVPSAEQIESELSAFLAGLDEVSLESETEQLAPSDSPTDEVEDDPNAAKSRSAADDAPAGASLTSVAGWIEQAKRPMVWSLALIGLCVVAAVLVFFASDEDLANQDPNLPDPSGAVTPPTPDEPRPIDGPVVEVGPDGHFDSLSKAVNYLRGNGTGASTVREIRITEDHVLSDTVTVNNSGLASFPRNISISGDPDAPPTLSFAGAGGPLVRLVGVENLTFQNLILKCNNLDQALQVEGYSLGTRFRNLTFTGISASGISALGVNGLKGRQVTIENCRFYGSSTKAVGIRFQASDDLDTRQIAIRGCRFIGPMEAGLAITDAAFDCQIRQNMFHGLEDGIVLNGTNQNLTAITFESNTFHDLARGIAFVSGPTSYSSRLSFSKNLFSRNRQADVWAFRSDADLSALTSGVAITDHNWTDRRRPGGLDLFINNGGRLQKPVDFVSVDPEDARFLAPKNSKLRLAGGGQHRFVGAVPPAK